MTQCSGNNNFYFRSEGLIHLPRSWSFSLLRKPQLTRRWLPSVFSFSSFILFMALITSTKIFTIHSVNFSWHIFSIFSFISYSIVIVSFNMGFYSTFICCSCWLQYIHIIIFSHFISWSTVSLSKIPKFCSCWSHKLNYARREWMTCTSDVHLPLGLHGVLLHVDLSLLEVLLSYLCYMRTSWMLQLSLGYSFSWPPFANLSFYKWRLYFTFSGMLF